MKLKLRDYQNDGIFLIKSALAGHLNPHIEYRLGHQGRANKVLYVLSTGGGKCLAAGTPVLMYDGSVKPVEAVNDNDQVMGPDGRPRTVTSTTSGQEMMYRVTPVKGDPYTVNESHILSLWNKRLDYVRNISVLEYMAEPHHWKIRHCGWRVPKILQGSREIELTDITVEPVGMGSYYGFTLEGPDRLFLLGDFTVTHNTATYAAIAEGAASKGNRVMILEHRKELIFQASMALARLGVMHQVVAPPDKIAEIKRRHVALFGQPYIRPNAQVAVASVQTLARRMSWLDDFRPNIIITDEAHHRLAGTWERIGSQTQYAIEIGVTATPCRTNGDGLGQVYQAMVQGPSMGWLIDNGFLVPFRVYAPPPKASFDKVHIKAGDYDPNELAELLDTPTITGDAVKHYLKLAPHQPGIVFCCNIRHATHVAEQFRAAGVKAQLIHGGMEDLERDRLINGLADGSVELLVSVDIISEGTDLPVAVVAIMLRLTQSLSLFLQQAGRVGRPVYASGYDLEVKEQRLAAITNGVKPFGIIIDHVGNVLRHGLPQSEQFWTLEGRRKRKRGQKEEVEQAPTTMQCPSCYQVHTVADGIEYAQSHGYPDGTICCTDCGHVYDPPKSTGPKQREGELKELVESEEEIQRRRERIEQGRAQTREALLAMGMSQRRAEHILQARREKERLQRELREVVALWQQRSKRPVVDAFGFRPAEIDRMKPKAMREAMEAISVAMFAATGEAARNDNEEFMGVANGG